MRLEWGWRLLGWGAVVVATVLAAKGVEARVVGGVLIGLAAVATQFGDDRLPQPVKLAALSTATVTNAVR